MGNSNPTDNYELARWVDTDKPTWRGDLNDTHTKIDDALHGLESRKADKSTLDYYVVDYGAVGDGITDDTAAIQAACDAAANGGGGIVRLKRDGTHAINGPIILRAGVGLNGGRPGRFAKSSLKYMTNTAKLVVGLWKTDPGAVNPDGDFAGTVEDLKIDCNGFGPTANYTGAVEVRGDSNNIQNVTITGAAGTALLIKQAQNSQFVGCEIYNSKTGIMLEDGCGGLGFFRLEVAACGTCLDTDDDPSQINPYPDGPADIYFAKCIFEFYPNGGYDPVILADIKFGFQWTFERCAFSNNKTDGGMSSGYLVKVDNSISVSGGVSNVEFNACMFNTSVAANNDIGIGIVGAQIVTISGYGYVRNVLNYVQQVSGAGIVEYKGNNYVSNVTNANMFVAASGASISQWYIRRVNADAYNLPTLGFAQTVKRQSDANIRGSVNSDFTHVWLDGAGTTKSSIAQVVDNLTVTTPELDIIGSLKTTKDVIVAGNIYNVKRQRYLLGFNVINASGPITIDSTVQDIQLYQVSGSGVNITGITLGSPATSQQVTVGILGTDANAHNITWPTNLLTPNTPLPTSITSKMVTVTFVYSVTQAKWFVTSVA